MKTYEVLCKTCGGVGSVFIAIPAASGFNSETCPVCHGSKTQTITETTPPLTQSKEILLT